MSERWVLAPMQPTKKMTLNGVYGGCEDAATYRQMLAARPPVSREWLDAAVERGAKAMCRLEGSRIPGDMGCAECEGECDVLDEGLSDLARAAILAVLEMTDG